MKLGTDSIDIARCTFIFWATFYILKLEVSGQKITATRKKEIKRKK
jgi:hypothetical protein